MAKSIFMSDAEIERICCDLKNSLNSMKCYGSISVKPSIASDKRIAMLYFDPIAWVKMTALVARFSTEVQWHGMVRRLSENEFQIYDIIVPPHEVSGATVTTEYKSYIEWMDNLDDDTFNSIRFHGHSHVNMDVSPSSVDEKYRHDLITQLPKPQEGDDVYYVFLIINKKHEWSAEIYDLTNNALYNTDEIIMECPLGEDITVDTFVKEAKKVAVERTYYANSWKNQYCGSDSGKQVTSIIKKEETKKKNGKKGTGADSYSGYENLEEYYAAIYGQGWDDEYGYVDEEDDPTSPFYVRGT